MRDGSQTTRLKAGCIPVISALLMSACSIPGVRWEDTDTVGPPLASGRPTKQIVRCDVVTARSGWAAGAAANRCDVAFRAGDGTQIDAFGVARSIDAALPRALPLRPLLEQFRSANWAAPQPKGRYTLYLVAINPTVVVGVPEKQGDSHCIARGWTTCFTATELYQLEQRHARRASFAVYYNTPPPVSDGAFVLVPEWQADSMPLSVERPSATFSEKGTVLTLVQRENTWRLSGSTP